MKQNKGQIGQTLVEFALIIPWVLILLLGFFDLGRAIFYYSSLSNAVREGTRYAIVNQDISETEIKEKILEYAFALSGTPNPLDPNQIDITYLPTDNKIKTNISISASYTFHPVTPFIATAGITLNAQSTMRISAHAIPTPAR